MASAGDGERTRHAEPEYDEVTLADIVRVLGRRRWVLVGVFLACLLGGVLTTVLTTPQYESRASVIPVEHQDIITNWLESRQAAALVLDDVGEPLERVLFSGPAPASDEAAQALVDRVQIVEGGGVRASQERFVEVVVTLPDPGLAREVANAYLASLEDLRPHLDNVTRQAAFERFYNGQNEAAAREQANATADGKAYWIPLDEASIPQEPVRPNPELNIALAAVLGLMLGVFTVFAVEWVGRFRRESKGGGEEPEPQPSDGDPKSESGSTPP